MSTQDGYELGWNDAIENDGADFVLLPAGEYDFEVVGFERARHPGSEKLPPCNKAIVSIKVDGGEAGETTIKNNLFLHSKCEGLLCQFFRSIGARKSGERLVMDWNKVVGSKGRCKIGVRVYNDKKFNEVKSFLDPVDATKAAGSGFKRGEF
jgi:hypothetical protein